MLKPKFLVEFGISISYTFFESVCLFEQSGASLTTVKAVQRGCFSLAMVLNLALL